jgi:hypothetical protein
LVDQRRESVGVSTVRVVELAWLLGFGGWLACRLFALGRTLVGVSTVRGGSRCKGTCGWCGGAIREPDLQET